MAEKCIAIETSVENVVIGQYYSYLYKGKICVGKAVENPDEKCGYTWAMENCYNGKKEFPYQKDIIEPNSNYSIAYATIKLESPNGFRRNENN